jgi:hypothetical protein
VLRVLCGKGRLFTGFRLSFLLLCGAAAKAEVWIPIGMGDMVIFIPKINMIAEPQSPGHYQLSWNDFKDEGTYKIERLSVDYNVEPPLADWQTISEQTTTTLAQTHYMSAADLKGEQTYRLSNYQCCLYCRINAYLLRSG